MKRVRALTLIRALQATLGWMDGWMDGYCALTALDAKHRAVRRAVVPPVGIHVVVECLFAGGMPPLTLGQDAVFQREQARRWAWALMHPAAAAFQILDPEEE
jgi:hypothetical protein